MHLPYFEVATSESFDVKEDSRFIVFECELKISLKKWSFRLLVILSQEFHEVVLMK